jgi:chitin disaccharide deacetylase
MQARANARAFVCAHRNGAAPRRVGALLLNCRVRRLIINADDLGLTAGVNRGIFETLHSGVVTSVTLMANSRAFDDAVHSAAQPTSRPFAIGCHVVLLDGEPVLPPERAGSLLAPNDRSHRLRDSLSSFAMAALRGRICSDEIEAEATAQMHKIQSSGISLSHFDAHKHAHLLPVVLKPLLRAAKACGIRALRNPFTPVKALALAHLVRRPHLWKRYSQVNVLRGFAARFRELVHSAGMVTTDGTFGIVTTGALDLTLFNAIVGSVPEGTWEFCCHPGYDDADLAAIRTRLRSSREKELQVLTSQAARETIQRHGIELISYRDLQ